MAPDEALPHCAGPGQGAECGSGSKRCETGALTGAPIEHEGAKHSRTGRFRRARATSGHRSGHASPRASTPHRWTLTPMASNMAALV